MGYIYLYHACNFPRNYFTAISRLHDGVILPTTTKTRILQGFVFLCQFRILLLNFRINKFKCERKNELNNDLSSKKKQSCTTVAYQTFKEKKFEEKPVVFGS